MTVSNTSPQVIKYQLSFTPSGEEGIQSGRQTSIEVEPGRTIALNDVLKTWFATGTTSSTGTLEIRPLTQTASSTATTTTGGVGNLVTFAASRTYNVAGNGTFGQFIPAIPFSSFVGRGSTAAKRTILSLQQVAQSAAYRTNLGLVEGSGDPATLLVSVFSNSGQKLTEFPVSLKGGQHMQMNSFLAAQKISTNDARVEVKVTSPLGKVTAYASVVDNATNDPLLVTPVAINQLTASKYVIPGVADLSNGSANWRTDTRVFNASSSPVEATLTFYSQNGGEPQTAKVTLAANEVRQLDSTLSSLFNVTNAGGALHISTATASNLIATARTYNQTSNGTYGQFISAVTPDGAIAAGSRPLQLLQIEESNRYRTNIGVAEVTGRPATVEVSVIPPDSKLSAVISLDLQGNQFVQLNQLLKRLDMDNTYNARVTVRVTQGSGRVTAYASVIDALTQDPTFVPAQ